MRTIMPMIGATLGSILGFLVGYAVGGYFVGLFPCEPAHQNDEDDLHDRDYDGDHDEICQTEPVA